MSQRRTLHNFHHSRMGSLWRWILCGSVVSISPNCAPLPCEKSSDVSATMCDVIFSENTVVDKKAHSIKMR